MNNLVKILPILFIICFVTLSCNEQSKKKIDNKIVTINDSLIKNNKFFTKHQADINSNLILEKTFYRINQTDTGDIIIDHYQSGLNGIIFTTNQWINFGFENFKMNIDSIIPMKNKYIEVHVCTECKNIFGEMEKDIGKYKIEPVPNKIGYIRINDVSNFIDSVYLNTLPMIKEKPYDIEEAIGDF